MSQLSIDILFTPVGLICTAIIVWKIQSTNTHKNYPIFVCVDQCQMRLRNSFTFMLLSFAHRMGTLHFTRQLVVVIPVHVRFCWRTMPMSMQKQKLVVFFMEIYILSSYIIPYLYYNTLRMCSSNIQIHIHVFTIFSQNEVTVLHAAADGGHTGTCEILLKNNANVNAVTKVSCFLL